MWGCIMKGQRSLARESSAVVGDFKAELTTDTCQDEGMISYRGKREDWREFQRLALEFLL